MVSELVPEATVSSWFTPTVLFVVLNVVIGTIAIRSKLSNSSQPDDGSRIEGGGVFDLGHDYQPRLLSRGSSIVARLKSMNLHRHVSSAFAPLTTETLQPQPPADADADAVTTSHREEEVQEEVEVDRFDSDSNSEVFETMEEAYMAARRGSTDYKRSRSEMDSLPLQRKVVLQELRKSATATEKVKAKAKAKATREEEDEVDARADDFINRFKRQLQLQRLESLDRLKKLINHGTGN